MKKSKEIKIKKLTKISIWPSILGAVFSLAVFIVLIAIILLAYISSVCSLKLLDMTNEVLTVVDYFESATTTQNETKFRTVERLMPNMTGITYFSSDGKVRAYYGEEAVNLDAYALVNEVFLDEEQRIMVYVPKGMEEVIVRDEKDYNLDIDIQKFINNPQVSFSFGSESDILGKDWIKSEVLGFDTVFLCLESTGNGFFAVKYRFSLCMEDYLLAVVVLGIVCILFCIFTLYHVVSTVRLIRDKKRAYNALFTDIITGGNNTVAFYKKTENLLKKNRGKKKYALVQIRLEKYKGLLTAYGAEWTENLTDYIYENLNKMVSKKEVFARIENAEFGLLLAYENEKELADRVRVMLERLSMILPNQKLYYNAGICLCPAGGIDTKAFYNNASIARSTAKDENAGEVNWFTDALFESQRWERKVEDEMDSAMKSGQFEMYLQPKYRTSDEVVGGAEALVRWNHPVEGLIPPGKFIPIFEKDGFILQLDDFMIEELAKQQSKWMSEGKKIFPISVNVSRAHFMMDNLAEHIRDIVDKYNVPHEFIELELTESAFFDDKKLLIEIVRKMREYGFFVSMDDFGAGYSSLNSLKEIPLDVVKLDADFFRGEGNDERGKIIVSETIELAKNLGMHIVAEGIETKEQVDFLTDRKCDLIQGYYYAKPMRVAEFEQRAFGGGTTE